MEATVRTVQTATEAETEEVGRALAAEVGARGLILLHGDLGAGKTAFVRGLSAGVGADPDEVSSPTFTVMQEYRGAATVLRHVDLYRLSPGFDVDELGLDDFAAEGLVAVEWAERYDSAAPRGAWVVRIAIDDDTHRTITIARTSGVRC